MTTDKMRVQLQSIVDRVEAGSRDVARKLGVEGLRTIAMQSIVESMQEGLSPLRKEIFIMAAAEATRQAMRLLDESGEASE